MQIYISLLENIKRQKGFLNPQPYYSVALSSGYLSFINSNSLFNCQFANSINQFATLIQFYQKVLRGKTGFSNSVLSFVRFLRVVLSESIQRQKWLSNLVYSFVRGKTKFSSFIFSKKCLYIFFPPIITQLNLAKKDGKVI